MRQLSNVAALVIVMFLPIPSAAEGLIRQLPEDGAWARFEVTGKGIDSDGTVSVTVNGTQTIRSVGRAVVDGKQCRWIELESKFEFERAGGNSAESNEIIKLLVPEQFLTKGANPCDHVFKAYRGSSAATLRELDLTDYGARELQGLDEVFHEPLPVTSELPAATIETGQQSWTCEGFKGERTDDGVAFRTETRLKEDAPFGVVTYKYEKERIRNNQSQGMRTMAWKLVESGTDAKSAAPDAQ